MPADITARHRAGGIGRLLRLRTAVPRHAATPSADGATAEIRVRRPRRWPRAVAVLAVLTLSASAPLALHRPGTPRVAVPLPAVSVPRSSTGTAPPAPTTTRPAQQAVRQAAKPRPATTSAAASGVWVLLGPGTDADLPPLLGSYCRAAHGPLTFAAPTAADWTCVPLGRKPVTLDMDAMCRWRYGDDGWADLARETIPRSWRCYRDA